MLDGGAPSEAACGLATLDVIALDAGTGISGSGEGRLTSGTSRAWASSMLAITHGLPLRERLERQSAG
jgi:hypothetical protein